MRPRSARRTAHAAKLADFKSLADALLWLDGHVNLEATAGDVKDLSLEPMAKLLEVLGNPQNEYQAVHITGTNGKGSVAAMITALSKFWGFTVGTYSSPHLLKTNERLAYNDEPIANEDLTELLSHLRAVENYLIGAGAVEKLSWFELLTAVALRWFADLAVDLAVVEVGKLGRYDATNMLNSRVGVITNIGRDHTDGKPGWQQKVMAEKAGILHPKAVAVLGAVDPNLAAIAARQEPLTMLIEGDGFVVEDNTAAVGGRVVTVQTERALYSDVYVSLFGEHQGQNAALAIVAFEALVDQVLDESVLRVLGDVAVPARFEVVGRQPLVVIDGAHNPDGVAAVAATLQAEFDVAGQTIWVLGMMNDKDSTAMLEAIWESQAGCDVLICCAPDWPRALPAKDLATEAKRLGFAVEVVPNVAEAVERALELVGQNIGSANQTTVSSAGAVMIAGSLHVAGAARLHLLGSN